MANSSTIQEISRTVALCYHGETYQHFWSENAHGHFLSRCFYDINFSLLPFLYLYMIGLTQFVLFMSSFKEVKLKIWDRSSFTLPFHLCLAILLTEIVHLIGDSVFQASSNTIFLSPIISSLIDIIAWICTSYLFYKERYVFVTGRPNGFLFISFVILSFGKHIFAFGGWNNPAFWWNNTSHGDQFEFAIFVTQSLLLISLLVYSVVRPFIGYLKTRHHPGNEYVPIILEMENSQSSSQPQIGSASSEQVQKANAKFGSQGASAFNSIWSKSVMLFPYVWPRSNFFLQLRVVCVLLVLLIIRVTKVFVPIYSKNIVNDLSYSFAVNSSGSTTLMSIQIPWSSIIIYCALSFLLGSGGAGTGFFTNLNGIIWISVTQYTYKKLQVRLFDHLHSLSLRFHIGRKTGAVLKILDRGTSSVTNVLHWILFQIGPAIIDIAIAVVYFVIAFDIWFGFLILTTMVTYIMGTIGITEWRTKWRRAMNELSNTIQTLGVDSLLNYETVKYYSNEKFEINQISVEIDKYNSKEWIANFTMRILNTFQSTVQVLGLFLGSILCAYKISIGELTVGDYVLFTSYLIQLYAPLNFFGSAYRFLQQAFIDMENMFELFDADQEIQVNFKIFFLQLIFGVNKFIF